MMTEEELIAVLEEHGCYLGVKRDGNTRFFSAKKRIGKTVRSRYLKSERLLDQLTRGRVEKVVQSF